MTDEEIDGFFAEFVVGFMFHDVEACIRARANFGVALMLLNYTEILGALGNGKLGIKGVAKECFEHGLGLMRWNGDAGYYCGFQVNLSEGGTTKTAKPYEIFRCGLAHEYFVKGLALVHNNADDAHFHVPADQGIGWIDHAGRRILRFHTNAYYRDLRAAFSDLGETVKADPGARGRFVAGVTRVCGRTVAEVV